MNLHVERKELVSSSYMFFFYLFGLQGKAGQQKYRNEEDDCMCPWNV